MTVGVVFHFEQHEVDVFSGRPDDLDAWRYACKAFGVNTMAMIDLIPNGTGVLMQDQEITFEKHTTLADFEAAHADDTIIYLECEWTCNQNGVTPGIIHQDFIYPDDTDTTVWYVVGPSNGFIPQANDGKTWVSVPQANTGAMHGTHVIGILLYDMFTGCGPGMM